MATNQASSYLDSQIMTYAFSTTAMGTRPTAWYLALHTADPTTDGTVGEVTTVMDSAYARKSLTFNISSNTASNVAAVTYAAVQTGATPYTVSYISVWTAATGGTCLFVGPLDLAKTLSPGDVLSFATAQLVLSAT
jgi:hypothetical protein